MKQVAAVLCMLRKSGKTIIVVTHDLELISCCAEYVVHMEGGSVKTCYSLSASEMTL